MCFVICKKSCPFETAFFVAGTGDYQIEARFSLGK